MTTETNIPFIRPGVLHFLGSFFHLDELHLLKDPAAFSLTPQRIEKGAKEFCEVIVYDPKKKGTGWEILYSALGIHPTDLQRKHNENDRNFVLRIWKLVFKQQNLPLSLEVTKKGNSKYWKYHISPDAYENAKKGMKLAQDRISLSPLAKSTPSAFNPDYKTQILMENADLFKMQNILGNFLKPIFESDKRLLFVCSDIVEARRALGFLRRYGADPTFVQTTKVVDKDEIFVKENLHEARVLLLSTDNIPLCLLPQPFDAMIIWNISFVLASVHAEDPLPDFISMSRKENRVHPPGYYHGLWKVADIFHFVRHYLSNTPDVLVTGVVPHSKEVSFLERVRGKVDIL